MRIANSVAPSRSTVTHSSDDDRACLGVHRSHAPSRDDLLAHEHRRAELRESRDDVRRIARPRRDARAEVAHREHAVRDDAGEPDHARHVVVLVERVLVTARVGVGADVLAGHDPCELRGVRRRRADPRSARLIGAASRSIMVERATAAASPSTPLTASR